MKPGRKPAVLISAAVALVAVLGAAIVWWPSSDQVTVTAHLSSAVGLYPGSDVRILGVKVGKVLSVTPDGASDTVRLEYDGKYRVPADAQAAVVSPSLVSDRYLQLLPAYTGGAAMRSGADIPLARTAVPVELDQVTGNLDQLTKALGPNGANSGGALSDLLDTASKNLDGNGQRINDTIANLSQATATLAGGKDDLFTTVKNLQSFTSTLAANDPQVRTLNTELASVSDQLSGERDDLGAALQNLAVALTQISSFVRDNRSVLTTDVSQLADVTSAVAKQKDALAETLRNAPVALSDLGHAYDPASGTLDNRVDIPGAEGVSQLLCALIGHGSSAATTAKACDLLNSLGDRLGSGGPDPARRPTPGPARERLVTAPQAPRRTPKRWATTIFALASLVLLSGCQGAYDLPLPSGSAMDGKGYQVTVQFADVLDLVPQSAVKVNDVTVGKVQRITVDGWRAKVTLHVDDSVHLPANATATLEQTSLLGEKYVELAAPTDTAPQGQLRGGAVIPLARTSQDPQVEDVLGALSLLLNGGGVGPAQGDHHRAQPGHPRQRVLDPRPGRSAGHLRRRLGCPEVPDRESARRRRHALRSTQRPEGRPGHRPGPPPGRAEAPR